MKNQKKIKLFYRVLPVLVIYSLILFISAWLADDAYITFRTVDNFINGYGLTWNISERVQTFTHPLWMLLLSLFYFLSGEIYYTSLIVSMIISLTAVFLLLYKLSESYLNIFLAGLILILSKSFIDYSTSGLENPLSHLLIVIFFIIYFKQEKSDRKTFLLALTASFAVLNRIDYILIFLPVLLLNLKGNWKKNVLYTLLGFIPFFIWEIFSLIYYGFLVPNTAYAKLNTGISQVELIEQGLYYFVNSLLLDPVTLLVILTTVIFVFIKRDYKLIPVAAGLILYMLYIVKIGGDFMSGRFFSGLLILSVIIISKTEIKVTTFAYASVIIIFLSLISPYPTIFYNSTYGLGARIKNAFVTGPQIVVTDNNGVVDERFNYYYATGLLRNISERKIYTHPWVKNGIEAGKNKTSFIKNATIGLLGFYSGPEVYILDPYALSDPLISKLPATEYWRIGREPSPGEKFWHIGHFARKIPDGYMESIQSGENKIYNKNLKKYYDKLNLVTKGEIFSLQRFYEIWNLNTGKYNYLLEDYKKTYLVNSGNAD